MILYYIVYIYISYLHVIPMTSSFFGGPRSQRDIGLGGPNPSLSPWLSVIQVTKDWSKPDPGWRFVIWLLIY